MRDFKESLSAVEEFKPSIDTENLPSRPEGISVERIEGGSETAKEIGDIDKAIKEAQVEVQKSYREMMEVANSVEAADSKGSEESVSFPESVYDELSKEDIERMNAELVPQDKEFDRQERLDYIKRQPSPAVEKLNSRSFGDKTAQAFHSVPGINGIYKAAA